MGREAAVNAMLRGLTPAPPRGVRTMILAALEAYSDRQVERFTTFGLRIWPQNANGGSMLPPEFTGMGAPQAIGTRARYHPPMRTIFVRADHQELDVFKHELAHVWDDVQNERGPSLRPLDSLPAAQRRRIFQAVDFQRRPVMYSQTARFRVQSGGRSRSLSLDEMRLLYKANLGQRLEFVFDETNSYKQSLNNAQEFYAEGRAVFFSRSFPIAHARMLRFAPELFQVFEQEAQREGLVYPDRRCLPRLFPPSSSGELPVCPPIEPGSQG